MVPSVPFSFLFVFRTAVPDTVRAPHFLRTLPNGPFFPFSILFLSVRIIGYSGDDDIFIPHVSISFD